MSAPCPDRYTGTSTPDCFSEADGYRFTKTGRGSTLSVSVSRRDGAVDTIPAPADGNETGAILLRRLAPGADSPELLISSTGSGAHGTNTLWSVWRYSTGSIAFRPAGSVYGSEFWDTGMGFAAQYSSGGGWAVTFARLDRGELADGVVVGREDTAGNRAPGSPDCTILGSRSDFGPPDPCGLALRQAHERELGT